MLSPLLLLIFLSPVVLSDEATKEKSQALLNRYKNILQKKIEKGLNNLLHENFKLYGCDQQARGNFLGRDEFWEKVKEFPSNILKVHDIEVSEAREFGDNEVIVRATVNGVKVEFTFKVQEDSSYLIYRERNYDCSNQGIHSTVIIDYKYMATVIAQGLMSGLVTGIGERDHKKIAKVIDDPYILKYCLKSRSYEFNSITFPLSGYDLELPSFHRNPDRVKTFVPIEDAKYHLNQSITFSVHGNGWNDYFEGTRRDGEHYKLKFHMNLTCGENVPMKLNVEEIQYSAFYTHLNS